MPEYRYFTPAIARIALEQIVYSIPDYPQGMTLSPDKNLLAVEIGPAAHSVFKGVKDSTGIDYYRFAELGYISKEVGVEDVLAPGDVWVIDLKSLSDFAAKQWKPGLQPAPAPAPLPAPVLSP